jgi:hypothetical protein
VPVVPPLGGRRQRGGGRSQCSTGGGDLRMANALRCIPMAHGAGLFVCLCVWFRSFTWGDGADGRLGIGSEDNAHTCVPRALRGGARAKP